MHYVSLTSTNSLVSFLLSEDASGNLTGYALDSSKNSLVVSMKSPGILAGIPFVDALANQLGCSVEWHVNEGEMQLSGSVKVATITGSSADLARGELLTKNILSRASAIATFASKLKHVLRERSWEGELVSPFTHTLGFSAVEEYAMFIAGVPTSKNCSSYLVPQSHVEAACGVDKAISAIKSRTGKNTQVTVECENLDDAKAAAKAGASRLRFSGLNLNELASITSEIKFSHSSVLTEVSADFDDKNVAQYALPHIDLLTTPRMFSGYPTLDFVVSYETGDGPIAGPQKRLAAPDESEQIPAAKSNSNEGKTTGNGADGQSVAKRLKVEASTLGVTVNAKSLNNNANAGNKSTVGPKAAGKNEVQSSSAAGKFNNNQHRKRERNHSLSGKNHGRQQASHSNRGYGNQRSIGNGVNHNLSNSPGLLSGGGTGFLQRNNFSSPQQHQPNQVTNSFFRNNAPFMGLLSGGAQGAQLALPFSPNHGGLIGGPRPLMHSHQNQPPMPLRAWAGPVQHPVRCRNCGFGNNAGVALCTNCNAPAR